VSWSGTNRGEARRRTASTRSSFGSGTVDQDLEQALVGHAESARSYAVLMRSTCGFPSSTDRMASYLSLTGLDVAPKNS
jgi:hypothetical protein